MGIVIRCCVQIGASGLSLAAVAVRVPRGSYTHEPWTVQMVVLGNRIDEAERPVVVALVGVDADTASATPPEAVFGWSSRAFSLDLLPPPQPRAQPTNDVLIAPMLEPITTTSLSFEVTVIYATQLPIGSAVLTVVLKRGSEVERIADTQILLTGTSGTVTVTVSLAGVGALIAGTAASSLLLSRGAPTPQTLFSPPPPLARRATTPFVMPAGR